MQQNCWSLRCRWSITCQHCFNYILIIFDGIGPVTQLPQCQWSNPEEHGWLNHLIPWRVDNITTMQYCVHILWDILCFLLRITFLSTARVGWGHRNTLVHPFVSLSVYSSIYSSAILLISPHISWQITHQIHLKFGSYIHYGTYQAWSTFTLNPLAWLFVPHPHRAVI